MPPEMKELLIFSGRLVKRKMLIFSPVKINKRKPGLEWLWRPAGGALVPYHSHPLQLQGKGLLCKANCSTSPAEDGLLHSAPEQSSQFRPSQPSQAKLLHFQLPGWALSVYNTFQTSFLLEESAHLFCSGSCL